jgi:adenylate kinase
MHRSTTYDNAPMPYMQRLTSKGIAIHAGDLPGYPASHGCIRLPNQFAKQLYGITELGTQVMITDDAEIAERRRIADDYRRAQEDHAQTVARQQAEADRVLINYAKAKAASEAALRAHEAEMARYRAQVAASN